MKNSMKAGNAKLMTQRWITHYWRPPGPAVPATSGTKKRSEKKLFVEKWTTGRNVSQSVKNVNKICFYVLC